MTEEPTRKGVRRASGILGRRLSRSFARVVALSTLICALLLFFLTQVAGFVSEMQRDESGIRQGLDLAMAVREQYMHAAHTMIVGDHSHLDHYTEWVQRVQAGAAALRPLLPEEQRWRVDQVLLESRDNDSLFRQEILPAALAGDQARVRSLHRRLDDRSALAAEHADLSARAVEGRLSHAHIDTTHVTYLAGAVAAIGILLLAGLAAVSTHSLRAAVLRPLADLAAAAARIGRGDFQVQLSTAAEGELGLVATAFERMVRELSDHQRRLVASERMAAIGQLAAGVAHEINNPIGVIRGYLRTMIPETDREELRKELQILDDEAAACQRIADDLLAYARSPVANKAPVAIDDLLRQTAERFQASGDSNGCLVLVTAAASTLQVDPVRIRQVVQNLLRNAAQASSPGARIEIRADLQDGSYVIRVLDRGSGITPELRPRIFEPFASGRPNGTGLGLAVCDGITRAHRGRIEARARSDGGSEFLVTLPLSAPPSEA